MNPDAACPGPGGDEGSRPPHDTGSHAHPGLYVTAGVPGTGGVIKQRPEDFLVDECPQYQPAGEGEHIYMLVQKKSLSTMEMIAIIARHFGVERGAVGYAGLKDKHAITRQVVSVHTPGRTPDGFPMLVHDQVAVLWTDLHTNKLRRGHLRGNRFSIRVRAVRPSDVVHAARALQLLRAHGVPNRIGGQRFGMIENNHLIGRALVLADYSAACDLLLGPSEQHPGVNAQARALYAQGRYEEARAAMPHGALAERRALSRLAAGDTKRDAVRAIDPALLSFYLSAFQSAVFNAVLEERLRAGTLATLVEGDIAGMLGRRASFHVDAQTAHTPETAERLRTFDISPTGPLWGKDMRRATGAVDAVEVAALERFGVSVEDLSRHQGRRLALSGERRPLRVPLIDPEVEGGVDEHGAYIRLAFELPKGSFATVVADEVMKQTSPTLDAGEEGETDSAASELGGAP